MRDGIWEGTGEGRGGTILVRITVTNHIITDTKAVSQSESSFAQEALNKVLSNAIGRTDYLSLETDGITGATLTSQGVIDALTMAITAAKGERSEEETASIFNESRLSGCISGVNFTLAYLQAVQYNGSRIPHFCNTSDDNTSSGVPTCTICPSSITTMRST